MKLISRAFRMARVLLLGEKL